MSVETPEANNEPEPEIADAPHAGLDVAEAPAAPFVVAPALVEVTAAVVAVPTPAPIAVPAPPVVVPVAASTFCQGCGQGLVATAAVCPKCGTPTRNSTIGGVSDKSRTVASVLCFFLGGFGVHRFYVGKVGTGVAMIFTLGGLGIWVLIDFIMILAGSFRDVDRRQVKNWS